MANISTGIIPDSEIVNLKEVSSQDVRQDVVNLMIAVETAGVFDIDSELKIIFNDGSHLQLDFKSRVDIKNLCWLLSQYVL